MRTLSGFSLGRGEEARCGVVVWGRVFVLGFLLVKKGEADVLKFHIRLPFDKWF